MFDTREVDAFARKLALSPNPDMEDEWRKEWSRKVADEWRQGVPVDTGEYRDSIEVTDEGVGAGAPHAPYVEYGTADTAPQPALLPAINRLIGASTQDAGRRVIRELT